MARHRADACGEVETGAGVCCVQKDVTGFGTDADSTLLGGHNFFLVSLREGLLNIDRSNKSGQGPGNKQLKKTKMKTIKFMTSVALVAAVALVSSGVCKAQEAVAAPPASKAAAGDGKKVEEDAKKVEETKKSWISGSVGTAVTNSYIFFGLVQDKDTFIAQPYLNLSFSLYEGEGFINAMSFELPLWWSLHDINKPVQINPGSTLRDWYEFDVSPGLSFTLAKNWSLTISDYIYTSPGDYFLTSHNLNLALTYDDSELLGAFALNPHFYFLQELDNHSGLSLKNGVPYSSDADQGQYYEFGIAPGHTFAEKSSYPLTVTFPATVGFGTNGFYGQGFGFFSTGVAVSMPLAFIPSAYGTWTSSLSGLYYRLGTNSARFTDNPNNTATGRRNQAVIAWSIGTEF